MSAQQDLSLPLIAKQPENTTSSRSSNLFSTVEVVLSIALPVLVYVQFSIVLPQEGSEQTLQNLLTDTVAFFLASTMYRCVLFENDDRFLVAHLLPEVVSLFTIVLAWHGEVFNGILCMMLGTLVMSLAVAWNCAAALYGLSSRNAICDALMTIGLPVLIFAQYHISFLSGSDMHGLTPAVVQCAVASFLLGSLMYRKVLEERLIECTLAHLFPELVAVGTILLTAYGEANYGFYCLVLGESVLAVTVLVSCLRSILSSCPEEGCPGSLPVDV